MKVLTLHPDDFEEACRKLAEQALLFEPQLIIGILTGGGEVGRRVASMFKDARYEEVRLQRKSTRKKSRLKVLLRMLPTSVNDILRCYEMRRVVNRKPKKISIELPEELRRILRSFECGRILVVDDAVDSGATLRAVVESIQKENTECEVRTAVLTSTCPNPVVKPDYVLWDDGVLLRFPWSFDYKG